MLIIKKGEQRCVLVESSSVFVGNKTDYLVCSFSVKTYTEFVSGYTSSMSFTRFIMKRGTSFIHLLMRNETVWSIRRYLIDVIFFFFFISCRLKTEGTPVKRNIKSMSLRLLLLISSFWSEEESSEDNETWVPSDPVLESISRVSINKEQEK